MTTTEQLFVEESKRFGERLDEVLASVDEPDERRVHQLFDSPKRQVKKIDALVKSGELDLGVGKERRLRIMIPAWHLAFSHVLNSWNTRDKLDELYARYHEAVSGGESQYPNVKENVRRKEALRVFEEIRLEFAAL
jgi:hypothetical protein